MKKVLIVDDSKVSRHTIATLFESVSYTIVGEAVDGLDGIQKAQELEPDIITVDLEMPNLSGLEMMKQLVSSGKKYKMIVISSIVNTQAMQEVAKLQASFIKKPLKKEQLLEALQNREGQ